MSARPAGLARLTDLYRRHAPFLALLLLFASFRLLALLLFRPGGFITDFSDYDFYYTWGTLGPMGYRAYDNLWTAYPPLFPALMTTIFELSSRIPAWIEPRLFFHVLLGLALLVFECGNLWLIYRLATRLVDEAGDTDLAAWPAGVAPLIPPVLYTLCFVPVYTLIGWFEPMPLFFLLLGLELLLVPRPWGWLGSAVAAGLGFLTKLTPVLLLPVAARWLGMRLSWRAARREWFQRGAPGSLLRPLLYALIFLVVVVGVGYPFVQANPALALSSLRVQSIRPPWQSLWAVIDGFYGYGLVPLDMRNLAGLEGSLWASRIPWALVGLAFVALYLWLYTRPYDWTRVHTLLAFTAVGVILLFLYSKGWSPQFLIWVLVFVALLLPTGRGVTVAVLLSLVNFVEADIFLILLPGEHWLMLGTVLVRTLLLVLLLVEFLGQIWPAADTGARLRHAGAALTWGTVAAALVAAVIAAPRAAQAYWEQRRLAHPCPEIVARLQTEAGWPGQVIVTQQPEVWRDLYPWLRGQYTFHVLDGYTPEGDPAEVVLGRANALVDQELWWVERTDLPFSSTSPAAVRAAYIAQPAVHLLEEQSQDGCRLYRMIHLAGEPQATASVDGGPVVLDEVAWRAPELGSSLRVVLYWHAEAPVTGRYTVFVQLVDAAGKLVAQQDNWPVQGLAPTDTWTPRQLIRDPYALSLPAYLPPGRYRLLIGLYDDAGRRPMALAGGASADALTVPVEIAGQDARQPGLFAFPLQPRGRRP